MRKNLVSIPYRVVALSMQACGKIRVGAPTFLDIVRSLSFKRWAWPSPASSALRDLQSQNIIPPSLSSLFFLKKRLFFCNFRLQIYKQKFSHIHLFLNKYCLILLIWFFFSSIDNMLFPMLSNYGTFFQVFTT